MAGRWAWCAVEKEEREGNKEWELGLEAFGRVRGFWSSERRATPSDPRHTRSNKPHGWAQLGLDGPLRGARTTSLVAGPG
jgi:hypothetical protein